MGKIPKKIPHFMYLYGHLDFGLMVSVCHLELFLLVALILLVSFRLKFFVNSLVL